MEIQKEIEGTPSKYYFNQNFICKLCNWFDDLPPSIVGSLLKQTMTLMRTEKSRKFRHLEKTFEHIFKI